MSIEPLRKLHAKPVRVVNLGLVRHAVVGGKLPLPPAANDFRTAERASRNVVIFELLQQLLKTRCPIAELDCIQASQLNVDVVMRQIINAKRNHEVLEPFILRRGVSDAELPQDAELVVRRVRQY